METARQSPKIGDPAAIAAAMVAAVWSLSAQGAELEATDDLRLSREMLGRYRDDGLRPSQPEDSPPGRTVILPARSSDYALSDVPAAFFQNQDAAQGVRGNGDEWGILARYRSRGLQTEAGLYWGQVDERQQQNRIASDPIGPPPRPDGDIQWSRSDSSLSGRPRAQTGTGGDGQGRTFPTTSNVVQLRLSAVYALPANGLWDSATLRLDAGRQRLTGAARNNLAAADPGASRHARSVQLLFAPAWSEVLPNVDVSLPVSLSYSPKSQAPLPGLDSNYKGGKFSIGASAAYQKAWNADLRYMHYFEEPASPAKDRNFLWLSIRRTF